MIKYIEQINQKMKTIIAFTYDFLACAISFYLSIAIRYDDFLFFTSYKSTFFSQLILVTAVQSLVFYGVGLYRGMWRYSSTHDLLRLIKGVTIATTLSTLLLFIGFRLESIPRTSIFIDWQLLVVLLGGARFTYRVWRDQISLQNSPNQEKVLLIGAGNSGEQLLREIKRNPSLGLYVEGFLDNDPKKLNKSLHGVLVLGNTLKLEEIALKRKIKKVVICIPSLKVDELKKITALGRNTGIVFKILPGISNVMSGKNIIGQLEDVDPIDLLGRRPIELDQNILSQMITNQVVFISGAGGSIGSELSYQALRLSPKKLVLFEQNEYNIYSLEQRLLALDTGIEIVSIIGDIRNYDRLNSTIDQHKPDVVFHAAAYKHVPLMESNPYESIHTNIRGTQNIAEIASIHNVKKFVMVSTDKAVNPTNIMGATKRIAEKVIQKLQQTQNNTKFITVRFGNVLGSSGSVVPLFKKQIKGGGPVTVTHKDIERYFMSIPEACQLVLQAGAMGEGGEVLVLDMGQPVKIDDLAREMISLSGLIPDKDIKIIYTGLRPGEKMYEELLSTDENTLPTQHKMVSVAKSTSNSILFSENIKRLLEIESSEEVFEFHSLIKGILPEFTSKIC